MVKESSLLSVFEQNIILLYGKGLLFQEMSNKLQTTEDDIVSAYRSALEKIERYYQITHSQQPRLCYTISQLLDHLGILVDIPGRLEVEEAIRIAQEIPDALNDLVNQFYPLLAKRLGFSVQHRAVIRIRNAICLAYRQQDKNGSQKFFEIAGIKSDRHIQIKKFIMGVIQYVESDKEITTCTLNLL